MRLIEHFGVDLVFDVGANEGQFGRKLRDSGFAGPIVSFEPVSQAFDRLRKVALSQPPWQVVRKALSDVESEQEIHISANSVSSSLLPMLPLHLEVAPEARYVGSELVQVSTLELEVQRYARPDQVLFAKIDAQGADRQVLEGAGRALQQFRLVQMEVSLQPLYERETSLLEVLSDMQERGYRLVFIEPGFSDPRTGRLLQADCIFLQEGFVS